MIPKVKVLAVFLFVICFNYSYSQRGRNGSLTVSSATIVNEYTSLTVNAITGNTSITVANSSLNSHGRFTAPLSAGDLIMIIQIQGANIKGTPDPTNPTVAMPDDSSWGQILNYNNCGNNEIREVSVVPNATTISLSCALSNNYTVTGNVQIVRIPRLSNLTVNTGGTISCDTWNGTLGGVIAIEVANNTIVNSGGVIDASEEGFRGGQLKNAGINYGSADFSTSSLLGAEKGEGIAGFESGYNVYGGMYCRGSAANGGGGGDGVNAGGGGGANAGVVSGWTNGDGTPDISNAGYITAWNLEYSWFSTFTNAGGGRGGYTWSNCIPNPLVTGPNNTSWAGDDRRSVGGLGGRPLDYSTGRLFLGGGGGAGDENNNDGGNGGNGGGIVYMISYGAVSGTGLITANGQNGGADSIVFGDGPGGAGGGGAVIINSYGSISGISIQANGGAGGSQTIPPTESEGPGGGGGGGYIATTNTVAETVNGGVNGTTQSYPAFAPNGATKGSSGIIALLPGVSASIAVQDTVFCKGDSVHYSGVSSLYSSSSSATWSWIFTGGTPATSVLQNQSVYYPVSGVYPVELIVTSCNSSDTVKRNVNVTITTLSGLTLSGNNPLCGNGGFDTLVVHGGAAYSWSSGQTTSSIIVSPSPNNTYSVSVSQGGCNWDTSVTVLLTGSIKASIVKDTSVCSGNKVTLTAKGGSTYAWSNGATTSSIIVTPTSSSIYSVIVGAGAGCKDTAMQTNVSIFSSGSLSACCSTTIQLGDSAAISVTGSGSYVWLPTTDILCDTCSSIVVRPNTTTTYVVQSTDSEGCRLTDSVIINVEGCGTTWIPNAFTPNGDGLNDFFFPKGVCIISYDMYIFDRWGQLIYQTYLSKPWNGQVNNDGIVVQEDTYVYELVINSTDRIQRTYIGKVTVIN